MVPFEINEKEQMVDLSIIIVNYNANVYLQDCLKSINEKAFSISYETWVVDNDSSDGSADATKENFPEVKWIQNQSNMGFSASVNKGLSRMNGRYALLLNPDTLAFENTLDEMTKFMDECLEVGILGPKVYDDSEKKCVQLSCRKFPTWKTVLFHRYSLLTILFPKNRWSREYLLTDWDHNETREVDWVSGCCMMIRKATLSEVGLFDDEFFMFNEDVDYCLRARQKGWRVVYFPTAEIVHFIGSSKGRVHPRLIIERHKSIRRYLRKHLIKNPIFGLLVDFVIFIRGTFLLVFNIFRS